MLRDREMEILIICSCVVISKVWKSIMQWLGFLFISLPNLFVGVARGKMKSCGKGIGVSDMRRIG